MGLYDGNGVFHNGPMQYWLAKVPTGTDINDFEAKGNDWFKIYHDEPYVTEYFLNNGKRVAFWQWLDNLSTRIPYAACHRKATDLIIR